MFIWAPVSRRTIRVCPTDTVKPPDAALEANLQADFQTLPWNLASIPEYAGGLRSMRNHGMTSGTFGANIGASCQSMMMTDLPSSNSDQSDFMEFATDQGNGSPVHPISVFVRVRIDRIPTIRVRRVAHGCLVQPWICRARIVSSREIECPSYEPNTRGCSIVSLQSIIYHGLDPMFQRYLWLSSKYGEHAMN